LDTEIDSAGTETNYGTEHWAFIPPDQLHRLKDMIEGTGHQSYIDSTPKIYFRDVNGNGILESDGDVDGDGAPDDMDGDGDIDDDDLDKVILVCGERKGGTSYFALNVTDPSKPEYLWRVTDHYDNSAGSIKLTAVNGTWLDNDFADHFPDDNPYGGMGFDAYVLVDGTPAGSVLRYDVKWGTLHVGDKVFSYRASSCPVGCYSHNVYGTIASISEDGPFNAPPSLVIPQLGETWSEPRFGLVKTSDSDTTGTPACFIGGGYSADNSKGKAVIVLNALTGGLIRMFTTGMNYSIPSTITVVDGNSNGFIDKLYVGDLGGQLWRIGSFTYTADDPLGSYSAGDPLPFPRSNENINRWNAQMLFLTDASHTRKFFYPPSVGLENGFDVVFAGTGDRENACNRISTYPDAIYCIKDTHSSMTFTGEVISGLDFVPKDLVDVTELDALPPDLKSDRDVDLNGYVDHGWFVKLVDSSGVGVGEKVLAEGALFYKVLYITTFTPNDEPCVPGGEGKLYALSYLTGEAGLDFDHDGTKERAISLGGGIPSKPVIIITDNGVKMYISVGSTNPDATSENEGAGIIAVDPDFPEFNFFYLWWNDFLP